MRLLHYLEVQNFKRFGETQRIELDHPTVLIGPDNSGKTTAIQAIALWSQAVRIWFERKGRAPPKERTATSLNRLDIVSVPVQQTRFLWHNTAMRVGDSAVPIRITVGVLHQGEVAPVTMQFRSRGDEIVYCKPDAESLARPKLIEAAAMLNIELLYPMSALETEEPVLHPGHIDLLLGQGKTGQVLRNLCLMVSVNASADWKRIAALMQRLFAIELERPEQTTRGSIDLLYRQACVKDPLDIALAGRGLQQTLLILAFLYAHRGSVLLIDEPGAHLEVLRKRQVYALLREIASETGSQVVLVTHSEGIVEEALDANLTLLLEGRATEVATTADIRNALSHYGARQYLLAWQFGYVLYLDAGTDLAILRELAERQGHSVADVWDPRVNVYYVQNSSRDSELESALQRADGSSGVTPKQHFSALRTMAPGLIGLAILDNHGTKQSDSADGDLKITYWSRCEAANYFVTPEALRDHAHRAYEDSPLFGQYQTEIGEVLDSLLLERIFGNRVNDFTAWQGLDADASRLSWEASTKQIKLSDFAEEFFRRLADRLGHPMLLGKSELHRLVSAADAESIPEEVTEKLDLLYGIFANARSGREA